MLEKRANPQPWRLVQHTRADAAYNMATDEALLRSMMVDNAPPTLRLYQWNGFAVSLGRFQSIERTVHMSAISDRDVPMVRRITGGRGILHGDDLTASLACRCSDLGVPSQVNLAAIYAVITGVFASAFDAVGIPTVPGKPFKMEPGSSSGDCFALISQADLVHKVSGAKVFGGALHRQDDVLLLQASAPLHTHEISDRLAALGQELFIGSRLSAGRWQSGPVPIKALSKAVVEAFKKRLSIELVQGVISAEESRTTAVLEQNKYRSRHWTEDGRSLTTLVHN